MHGNRWVPTTFLVIQIIELKILTKSSTISMAYLFISFSFNNSNNLPKKVSKNPNPMHGNRQLPRSSSRSSSSHVLQHCLEFHSLARILILICLEQMVIGSSISKMIGFPQWLRSFKYYISKVRVRERIRCKQLITQSFHIFQNRLKNVTLYF